MMLTWTEYLFYPFFLMQILLISWYLPERLLGIAETVRKQYPPEQYPKLYPDNPERYLIRQEHYRLMNRFIAGIGVVVIVLMLFVVDHSTFADDGYISEIWPAIFGLLQFLPLLFLEFAAAGQMKRMREENTSTARSADLAPRRLFDYVPAWMVGAAIVAILGATAVEMSLYDWVWSADRAKSLSVIVLVNGFFLSIGYKLLKGRKPDPHQAAADRVRVVKRNLRSLLMTSIAISVFMVFQSFDRVYAIDFLDAVAMSVYFQVIAMLSFGYLLQDEAISKIDYEVYRKAEA